MKCVGRLFLPVILLGSSLVSASAAESEIIEPAEINVGKPFAYSFSLMGIGLPLLIGSGAFEEGPSLNNFKDAWQSPPEWEDDSALFNFVLHPLWGSETYLRAREANWGVPGSIAFSMGMSVTWEYMMESWVTHPSAQDLIFTTGIGWMIGEARYKLKQRKGPEWDWVLDPIHTTIEHVNVKFLRHGEEDVATVYTLSWEF